MLLGMEERVGEHRAAQPTPNDDNVRGRREWGLAVGGEERVGAYGELPERQVCERDGEGHGGECGDEIWPRYSKYYLGVF